MRLPASLINIKEVFLMALDSIRGHKFRSFLTVLGIVVGVVVVIVVASILTGLRQNIVKMVEDYGTNNIYVFHLSTGPRVGERSHEERMRKPLVPADAEAIRQFAPAVEDVAVVAPNIGYWGGAFDDNLTYKGQNYRWANTQGVSPNYAQTSNLSLAEGRFFTSIDDDERREVMVIGVNAAKALFPEGGQIAGTTVKMGGRNFEIIGVLEKRKAGFFGENEEDNAVFIPFKTAQKVAPGRGWIMFIVRAKSGQIRDALQQTEEVLRRRRNVRFDQENNFDINTADKIIEQFDQITAAIGLAAIAISGLGLLVGGIGVMNIMLVSVTERTKEIGIRKAIGARRRDIVRQFLYEAMTLTFLGGLLGVAIAVGFSKLIMLLVPSLPAAIPLWAVLTGLGVATGVGLVFGVWPALKASRLDPIEALRYE
ncbi:MAG TPA: ABC transporter permease [Pyrinomonadaceae bacterium]|nr:ABC transporter permease [Pyrinomonadaceae bacterium]